ncbi:periphilin-1 [Gadus chalcogrammus]|uniref:periphilin-1 n=1 Tax=Gadus chalcogrammus TaxID=1042646 RepID=UPI0024C4B0E1|nr:periphilin-1 [Gadus chalcogrammus]XP_056434222.1 periphilin-1 [Gadus chalcogrammus]
MTYRRERSTRDVYEERFIPDRAMTYPRAPGGAGGERRGPFGRPDEDYGRGGGGGGGGSGGGRGGGGGGGGYEYEGAPRYFPNGGGPRSYHAEEQRGYHGDGRGNPHFPAERRAGPPARREEYPYRVPREDPHPPRTSEFGPASMRAPPPHPVRTQQGMYPAVRSLPESGDDSLMQAILSLDRSAEDRESYRRKAAPFPPIRERSPPRRTELPRSPHSRSGSSVSSRSYSPERAKALPFTPQQGKAVDAPEGHAVDHLWGAHFPLHSGHDGLDKVPGLSRDVSPQSTPSIKEEVHPVEAEREEPVVVLAPVAPLEEIHKGQAAEDFQERRAHAISAKALDIEKVYRQDCETFGMVVKMLVAKDPNLEKQLQVPLRENLGEIRERCLEDLKHFISELDEAVRQPDTLA